MRSTSRTAVSLRIVAMLVLATMALVSCGSGEEEDVIRLQANAVGGGQVYYENLASEDTVLWFWAPW